MGDSSDSEEFYDAEEFTPVKGSKRSSLCKNINLSDIANAEKENAVSSKEEPTVSNSCQPQENEVEQDDRTTIKSVVQGRKRFQELRRCMQTEEEDDADPAALMSAPMEHPFKIISHDAMSLQSMTSLGRIGKILSGVTESHPNIRDCLPPPSASSREPSTASEDPITIDRTPTVLAMAEPDVIASTKANSLKQNRSSSAVVAVSGSSGAPPPRPASAAGPVAPPRRRKRNKLHGSQSLSTADDNVSVCTTDTDELYRPYAHLDSLHVQPPANSSAQCMLPSPASTIESLTKEFQDSLELSQSKYAADMEATARWERHDYDVTDSARGDYAPRMSEEAGRGGTRTHSEGRPTPAQPTDSSSRSSTGGSRTRRRSAGDSPARVPQLSDSDILTRVTVLNLDTGERMPLSEAEHKLPQCINPLSLHIMRLTSEYHGRAPDDHTRETDEESESVCAGGVDDAKDSKREPDKHTTAMRRRTDNVKRAELVKCHSQDDINIRLKRFFGSTVKRTVDAALSLAQEVSAARHKEDVGDIPDLVRGEHNIKLKASNSHRGPYDFDGVRHVQEMGSGHTGAVWCCKFSGCGRLLATAGQDRLLRVWVTRDSHHMFQEMRTKYNKEKKASPSPSTESLRGSPEPAGAPLGPAAPFCPQPFATYAGHTSDLLDVSWSKNYFLLSSSMDKTVRLWHVCRGECLCCFQHIDFVTAIAFHPRDDRYFLSGSLDGKLRLWDIPDKKVAVWNEVDGKTKLITAANFCQNGKFAVVGTYDGRCIFYTTDQLKYHTQIDVRSSRGKNSTGRKISGIEPMPNDDKILVTSNDSRIRLYDLRDLALSCKYRGYTNVSSQIRASFSHDGKYIVSGSENQCIYVWKTCHDYSKFASVRRDRNDFWEGIRAHGAVVTCAVFAPSPDRYIRAGDERERAERGDPPLDEHDQQEDLKAAEGGLVSRSQTGHVLVSADFNGCIKVFVHKAKPKHSSLPASALA